MGKRYNYNRITVKFNKYESYHIFFEKITFKNLNENNQNFLKK